MTSAARPSRVHCCFQAPNPAKGRICRAIGMTIPLSLCTMGREWQRAPLASPLRKPPGLGATDGSTMAATACPAGAVRRARLDRAGRDDLAHPRDAAPLCGSPGRTSRCGAGPPSDAGRHIAEPRRHDAHRRPRLRSRPAAGSSRGHRAGGPPARRSQRAVGRAGLDRWLDSVAIDSRERCDH